MNRKEHSTENGNYYERHQYCISPNCNRTKGMNGFTKALQLHMILTVNTDAGTAKIVRGM